MRYCLSALLCLAPFFLDASVSDGMRRIQAHLLIDDPDSALQEAIALSGQFPDSKEAGISLIEALSAAGQQETALNQLDQLSLKYPMVVTDRNVLEQVAWGVLRKELGSTQYGVRLGALIGCYLTRDVRAIPIMIRMMRDSNAVIRSVAVQMSCSYGDAPFKDEIKRMMTEEKVWMVRLQVIQAVGALRIHSMAPKLHALVQSDKTMIEERQAAIESLIHMTDSIDLEEIIRLSRSNRAGLRQFSLGIATHFREAGAKDVVIKLLNDSNPDVRVSALNSLGLYYRETMTAEEVKDVLKPRLEESDPRVSITAAWVAMLLDPNLGRAIFEKWLGDSSADNRRFAASALAATGGCGISLCIETLNKNTDPYVRANVAMGLIGQRLEIKGSSDCLYDFLSNEKKRWMWDSRPNPLFQVLAPSQVRHIDQIPNYPEAIDQMTRLKIVSMLAMVEDPRAIDALKSFLSLRKWNITGVAAATLLQEGDDTSLEVVRLLLEDTDAQVCLQACLVLAMYGKDETVLRQLQDAYPGSEFEMKLSILEALGSVGGTNSFSFLLGVLREPFPMLRVAGAAALLQSINR
jgi:HEAT repeat protein